MIVSNDAWAGVTFEHAWGDGVAVLRFFNEINQDAKAHQWSNNSEVRRPKVPPTKICTHSHSHTFKMSRILLLIILHLKRLTLTK